MLDRKRHIKEVVRDHSRFREAFNRVVDLKLEEKPLLKDWSARDILAHLSEWDILAVAAVGAALSGKVHYAYDGRETTESMINDKAIAKRKLFSNSQLIKEWEASFEKKMSRLRQLTQSEWQRELPPGWDDARKHMYLWQLFDYTYNDSTHEGGHAKQLEVFARDFLERL